MRIENYYINIIPYIIKSLLIGTINNFKDLL